MRTRRSNRRPVLLTSRGDSAFFCQFNALHKRPHALPLTVAAALVSLSPDGASATRVMFSGEVPDRLRTAILDLPEGGDHASQPPG